MDEPLSNLDANLRVHARGEIVELHRKAGVPTLYVTHDQAEALSMADRVAVMIGGNLLQLPRRASSMMIRTYRGRPLPRPAAHQHAGCRGQHRPLGRSRLGPPADRRRRPRQG